MLQAFLLGFLATVCVESMPCKKGSSHPKRGNIAYYRKKFLFMRNRNPKTSLSLGSAVKSRGVVQGPGTSKCPWVWGVDTDTKRKPITIAVAKCDNCDEKCRQVVYNHNVLVHRKDCRTGEDVWAWRLKALPVAYVYDV